jgi:16S rRNA C967 or C1407 C5-methylase (RsmB/RsmF family)
MALKPGGILVYSTCSINPQENDGVIQKLLKKQEGVEIQEFKGDLLGQATTYGTWYLPDQCLAGPMYVAVLKKGV